MPRMIISYNERTERKWLSLKELKNVNTKPHISYERAWSWTKSFQRTEGLPHIIRVAQAFKDTCNELSVNIWEGELVVGTSGEYRKCAILTPEFGWLWINDEIDTFPERGQDPYDVRQRRKSALTRDSWIPTRNGETVSAKSPQTTLMFCCRKDMPASRRKPKST